MTFLGIIQAEKRDFSGFRFLKAEKRARIAGHFPFRTSAAAFFTNSIATATFRFSSRLNRMHPFPTDTLPRLNCEPRTENSSNKSLPTILRGGFDVRGSFHWRAEFSSPTPVSPTTAN